MSVEALKMLLVNSTWSPEKIANTLAIATMCIKEGGKVIAKPQIANPNPLIEYIFKLPE